MRGKRERIHTFHLIHGFPPGLIQLSSLIGEKKENRQILQQLKRSINDIDVDMTLRMKKKLLVRGGMTSGGHPGLDTRIIPPLPA